MAFLADRFHQERRIVGARKKHGNARRGSHAFFRRVGRIEQSGVCDDANEFPDAEYRNPPSP